jgi:predicted ATP-grasp superfamily ATP-dependent carboligase
VELRVGRGAPESNMGVSRILVTDAYDRQGLAAVRCLHEAGYRVSAAANTWVAPGLWSRSCSDATVLPDPRESFDEFIDGLEERLREDRYDVLIPGKDEDLYAISRRRHRIEPYVALGLPDHGVVERALDRACLTREAEKVGLAGPAGHVCDQIEQALDLARAFGFPVVVKPVGTITEVDGRLVRHSSRLVLHEQALRDAQQYIGKCIVQRQEPGNVISFGGVATERGLLGSVISRYRRTWPPHAGSVCFSETIASPGALTEQVKQLVAAIGWRGLFELELIELEGGKIEAIDFNPRIYGSLTLARAAGAPLVTLWCAWLLGENPKPATARLGVRYRWEDADARHIVWQLRHRDYRGAAVASLPQRGATHAFFQTRDPLPSVARGVAGAVCLARRRSKRTRAG